MKKLIVFFVSLSAWAQVPAVPNSDFPTFRTNMNASLAKAANITINYSNPSWISSLAFAKITGVPQFVPIGGTVGQVLTKVDSTNYNTTWATPTSGIGPTGPTGPTGPSGSQTTCTPGASPATCTHNLNVQLVQITCADASTPPVEACSATSTGCLSTVEYTSTTDATLTYTGTLSTCKISTGGAGASGAVGPTGPTGAQGIIGNTGPQGVAGGGAGTISGTFTSTSSFTITHNLNTDTPVIILKDSGDKLLNGFTGGLATAQVTCATTSTCTVVLSSSISGKWRAVGDATSGLNWSTLTNGQWTGLTNGQWTGMSN